MLFLIFGVSERFVIFSFGVTCRIRYANKNSSSHESSLFKLTHFVITDAIFLATECLADLGILLMNYVLYFRLHSVFVRSSFGFTCLEAKFSCVCFREI